MKIINRYVETFEDILFDIQGSNTVIAGTNNLLMHGLIMNRMPEDLDIIIFKPTKRQDELLNKLKEIRQIPLNEPDTDEHDYTGEIIKDAKLRSIKIQRGDLCLNFILERHLETPSDLLYARIELKGNVIMMKCQSISANIEAKAGYKVMKEGKNGLITWHRRLKDVIDFQDLKNSNFNF